MRQSYTLNEFEKWVKNEMRQFFNPIANIIATNEERKRNSTLPFFSRNNNLTDFTITFKISYWYCTKEERIPSCQAFINLKLED